MNEFTYFLFSISARSHFSSEVPHLDEFVGWGTQAGELASKFLTVLVIAIQIVLSLFSIAALAGAGVTLFLLYKKYQADRNEEKPRVPPTRSAQSKISRSEHFQTKALPPPSERILNYHASLEILGLPPGASMQEVKGAYRALSKRFHPDIRDQRHQFADEKLLIIRRAYETLCLLEEQGTLVTRRAQQYQQAAS